MKTLIMALLGLTVALGCARVRVEAPKEAIKLDITMRLDIYQHIKNDIDDIENLVTGTPDKAKAKGTQSFLNLLVSDAYASEGLSPEIEAAALRRKNRYDKLTSWEAKGIIGENKLGLLEVLSDKADSSVQSFVSAENSDRMIIYQAVAAKNGSSVEDVQKIYAKRLQADAVSGTQIEGANGWKTKN